MSGGKMKRIEFTEEIANKLIKFDYRIDTHRNGDEEWTEEYWICQYKNDPPRICHIERNDSRIIKGAWKIVYDCEDFYNSIRPKYRMKNEKMVGMIK